MHARAASSRTQQFSETDVIVANQISGAGVAAVGRKKQAVRQIYLTREQEYAFIRADMRRLLLTAGGLFVLMIALLFVLD
jgi:hypothetical protein